jgi:hypothetical protein
MLIGNDFLQFCADKTRAIIAEYNLLYGSTIDGRFWRSADELHGVMSARHGKPIYHKKLGVHWRDAKYRSFYVPYADKYEIWYAEQLPPTYLRYYKTKELLQIELWHQSLITGDVVELVRNMILRDSPASVDLDLGHPATADTLGELAAAEFLFPLERRIACLESHTGKDGVSALAEEYQIPAFLVQRSLNHVESLKEFFCDG